jgi:hypothetical protein
MATLYTLRKALFFVLLWLRPLVHLPLRLLSYSSLLAFGITLLIPHPVPFRSRVLMVSIGIGTLVLIWAYDALLGWLSDDILFLGD